jgi:phage repressor protein C with HTH and peptisase S24 domain
MNKSTIDDHRRKRMKELVELYGSQAALADQMDVTPGYLSQVMRAGRHFSEKTARKFEELLSLPRLWLDIDELNDFENVAIKNQPDGDFITIQQYTDVRGAMGKGAYLLETEGEVIDWRVTPEWASSHLPANTGLDNLRIITGLGDSMKGLYNSGDPLIVDTGINAVDFDAVYFFRIGDEGYVKRLQKTPGGILVISQNPDYRDWTITGDMDLEVFGRVLKVWEGKDL